MARAGMRRRQGGSRKRGPVRIGLALEGLVRQLWISGKLSEYDVLTQWEEIVGAQVARVTVPERIDNGVLLVHVASAPWRAELTLRRREILDHIKARTGRDVVRDIRFR